MPFSNKYIVVFSLAVCLGCSLVVSLFAVTLKERQQINQTTDMQRNILRVCGVIGPDDSPSAEEMAVYFEKIKILAVDRKTGNVIPDFDASTYDPVKAAKDVTQSSSLESSTAKLAQVKRAPDTLLVYDVEIPGKESYVFQVWGNGLWSTLYGFICLEKDGSTVKGLTYYEHKETPGLGGEVDNPKWKATWAGKSIFDDEGKVAIVVKKGGAKGKFEIDALSGATITSNGVTWMMELWFGDEGYGKFLSSLQKGRP